MSRKENNGASLLLHTCCAQCAVRTVEALGPEWEITLYYDNSNIHPRTEWLARLEAVKQVAKDLDLKLIVGDWIPKNWYTAVGENVDNKGQMRCRGCWEMRIQATAERATRMGIGTISTTLLSSKYQNSNIINKIGKKLAKTHTLMWVEYDIGEHQEEEKESRVEGFYRQNYCGCVYSLKERMEEKWTSFLS